MPSKKDMLSSELTHNDHWHVQTHIYIPLNVINHSRGSVELEPAKQ